MCIWRKILIAEENNNLIGEHADKFPNPWTQTINRNISRSKYEDFKQQ